MRAQRSAHNAPWERAPVSGKVGLSTLRLSVFHGIADLWSDRPDLLWKAVMECPCHASHMRDLVLAGARGAEYRARSETFWRCPECHMGEAAQSQRTAWLTEPETVLVDN